MNQPDTVSFSLQGTLVSLVKADVIKHKWSLSKLISTGSLPFDSSGDTAYYIDVDSTTFKLLWSVLQSGENIETVAKKLSGMELSLLIRASTTLECHDFVTALQSIKQGLESEMEKMSIEIRGLNKKVVSLEAIFDPITTLTCGNKNCPQVGVSRVVAFGSFSGIGNALEKNSLELMCRYCGLAGFPCSGNGQVYPAVTEEMFVCGACTKSNLSIDLLNSNSCSCHGNSHTFRWASQKGSSSGNYVCGYCAQSKKKITLQSSNSCNACAYGQSHMFEYRIPCLRSHFNKLTFHDIELSKDELDFINRRGPASAPSK